MAVAAVVIVDDGPYIDDDINEFSGQVTDELLCCCCCPLYEIIDDDDDAGGWQKFGKRNDPIIGETDDTDVPSFDDMAVVDEEEIIVRCLSDDDEHKSTFWCGCNAGLLWWTTAAEDGIIIDELWSLMLAFFTEINCLALNAEYAWLVVVIIGSNKPG